MTTEDIAAAMKIRRKLVAGVETCTIVHWICNTYGVTERTAYRWIRAVKDINDN